MACQGQTLFSPGVCTPMCPTECSAPTCAAGDPSNGGQQLTDGKCTYQCSKSYGGYRYCGGGPTYSEGGLDCTKCSKSPPQPTPAPKPVCPTECSSPTCAAGDPSNGGQ